MPIQNPMQVKEKIVEFITLKGPSLPIHVARYSGLSVLFASAFLSELISEQRIKISHLRVGNSPLYFIPGQEKMLEAHWQNLKSKEKEAFLLLKENKFLVDEQQEPAIRVALRAIKDYAFPFNKQGKVIWRYITANESEFTGQFEEVKKPVENQIIETPKEEPSVILEIIKEEPKQEIKEEIIEIEKRVEIFDKPEEKKEIQETKTEVPRLEEKPKKKKSKTSKKQDDKFFNKVKEFLSKESIEIINIEGFDKNGIFLRVKIDKEEQLLAAFNKKKVSDSDLIKAYKKASEQGISYFVLCLGEVPKKLNEQINAYKILSKIEKME